MARYIYIKETSFSTFNDTHSVGTVFDISFFDGNESNALIIQDPHLTVEEGEHVEDPFWTLMPENKECFKLLEDST